MINLCYVINVVKNLGPCNVIYNLTTSLSKTRYKIFLITLYRGNDEELVSQFRKNGVEVTELNYKNRCICFFNVKHDLTEYCVSNNIHIIHSHTLFSDLSVSMIRDVIKISTIHNRTFEDYKYLFGEFMGKIIAKMHIHIFKKFDMCVCCSKSVFDEQRKYLNNLSVVQNGICLPYVNEKITREDIDIPKEACIFIYVGSLSRRKNVVTMIKHFVNNRRACDYLLVLGEGQEMEACKAVSDEHVKLLGFVNNPSNYYSMADVYISASLSEGLSLSQLEAMAFGLKQLVSDIPSHREVVETDPVVGNAFTESDFSEAFSKTINDIGVETKQKIKAVFTEKFSVENMVNGYDELYYSIRKEGVFNC